MHLMNMYGKVGKLVGLA